MAFSDFISVLALVVAIAGTILSIWYTRRALQITSVPALEFVPFIPDTLLEQQVIEYHLKNLSSSIAVSDIRTSCRIYQTTNSRKFKRIGVALRDDVILFVAPQEGQVRHIFKLNDIMLATFSSSIKPYSYEIPSKVLKKGRRFIDIAGYDKDMYDEVPRTITETELIDKDICYVMEFNISYKPSVYKGKVIKFRREYMLSPTTTIFEDRMMINKWVIKNIPGKSLPVLS